MVRGSSRSQAGKSQAVKKANTRRGVLLLPLAQLKRKCDYLMEKYDGVERSLVTKCDSEIAVKMDKRTQALEERLSRIESNLNHRAQYRDTAVEDQLSCLEARLASTSVVGDNMMIMASRTRY